MLWLLVVRLSAFCLETRATRPPSTDDYILVAAADLPFCSMTPNAFLTISLVSRTINRKLTGKTS